LDPSSLRDWLDAIRLDFSGPAPFVHSLGDWLGSAPTSVMVMAAGVLVAALAFSRRPGAAAMIVLAALGVLGVAGLTL
jgi:hypothetical protein